MSSYTPEPDEIVAFLQHTEFFRELRPAELKAIGAATAVKAYEAGASIVNQGDQAEEFYVIASGRAQVYWSDPDLGQDVPLVELGQFESFGEMALLCQSPRSASVKALESTYCVTLSRYDFEAIMEQMPLVAVTIARYLARRFLRQSNVTGFQYVNLTDLSIDPDLSELAPSSLFEQARAIPIKLDGAVLTVAMSRPQDPACLATLREALPGLKLKPVSCDDEELGEALQRWKERPVAGGTPPSSAARPAEAPAVIVSYLEPPQAVTVAGSESEGRALFEQLLGLALARGGDEVHLEVEPRYTRLALRIDGALVGQDAPAAEAAAALVNWVGSRGGLTRADVPGEATLQVSAGERSVDVRASLLPTGFGHKVWLRLLDFDRQVRNLSEWIPAESIVASVRASLRRPGGLVLVVGPTRSGKQVTLRAALADTCAQNSELLAITVESPILAHFSGLTQTQVREPDLSYPTLLRAALDQNPDLLMVSEIRDQESARIVLEASLASCSVLAGMFAPDPLSALTRLHTMGCSPYLVASSLDMVLGQRMLRRICPECRSEHDYSEQTWQNLERAGIVPVGQRFPMYRGAGCARCAAGGYRGQVGAFEMLSVSESLREALGPCHEPQRLRQVVREHKALATFKQSSRVLLETGRTTPAEVLRYFSLDIA